MKNIKFRVWDKEEKIILKHEDIKYINFCDKSICLRCGGFLDISDNPYVLMQYTGIKDKNGKEIYEGDIVKNYRHNTVTECIYNDHYISFSFKDDLNEYFYFAIDSKHLEVIGNIYENPKLLEEGNNESL